MKYTIEKLGNLIKPAPPERAGENSYPILSITMHSGLIDQSRKFKKRVASKDTSQYKVVKNGQLVVGFPIDEGLLSFQKLHPKATVSPAYSIWDCTSEINKDYLEKYLRSPKAISYYSSKMKGSTARRRNLTQGDFLNLPVPIFSQEYQKKISYWIDQADHLRSRRKKSIELLDELTQSIFLDMFGKTSPDWPTTTVQDVAEPVKGSIRTGPFGSQLLHEEFVDEGIHVLGIDNATENEFKWGKPRFITEEKYQQLSRYTVKPGDVLITIMGTCGRCAIVPDDIPTAINTKHLCCITLDQQKCIPEFLHSYFLMHPLAQSYLHRTAKGAIMSGLNMGIIKALPIALPPLELQHLYAERTASVREQKKRAEAHLSYLDELFASVQQRAFDGTLWDDPGVAA